MNSLAEISSTTMADVRAFRALRYDTEKLDLAAVIAPPYDVISKQEQKDLYARSSYNCVRLILNEEEASDHDQYNRYTRARDLLKNWEAESILVRDEGPCFYLYRQRFRDENSAVRMRSAILGTVKLEPFEKHVVIPHERTLSQPCADRRKLLETTKANLSPVFGLYEDHSGTLGDVIDEAANEVPLVEAEDDRKVTHSLWKISSAARRVKIRETFNTSAIYIADGHHRYQTALEYAGEMRRQAGASAKDRELPSDFVLMALVEFHDPGLVLLPTHRIVLAFPEFDKEKALAALTSFFNIESIAPTELETPLIQPSPRWRGEGKGEERENRCVEIGLFLQNQKAFRLTLKNFEQAKKQMPPGRADRWYGLDVTILGYLILAKLWNLPEEKWESALRFTHDYKGAVEAVEKGAVASFILKTPPVEILRDMGQARELMPQKSTYFYPKLASGLVFYKH